ncbi:unnamed protein product [Caenorhabditis auriculariae]|uniref:E3 ubiquitin-protein ligase n=1 Tax=Caenorhabditis auriculariae TaxID=2777116 RepID=A0A8S1HQS2_9PELO|nr:unnamed protein product [Caenorhabditis auriculariae]
MDKKSWRFTPLWLLAVAYQRLDGLCHPLVGEPLNWRPRRLLQLPAKYDDFFSRYFHRVCSCCEKVPTNPVICLLCAQLICLDECCRVQRDSEIERHADACSASSGLFLSLNSSLVIVVRTKMAAIWGSVYLDAHMEEDRNLRRGKPLHLSAPRWRCLEHDWAEQEWQSVNQWFQLSGTNFALQIRDAYLYNR